MKKLFINLAVILIIPALYFVFISAFTKSDNTESERTVSNTVSTDTTKFVNMIQNMDYVHCDSIWIGKHLNEYKELGYNAAHVYPSDNDTFGTFLGNYSQLQIVNNNKLIDSVHNRDLKFFYEQVKFSYLCYAQRLVYLVSSNGNYNANNGFCFIRTNGTLEAGDTTVLLVEKLPTPAYTLVCDSIYENLQHSDYFGRQQDKLDWFVKPMVKLDTNNITDNTPVFTIVYYSFSGDSIGGQTILASNFKNPAGIYNGDYTDKFYRGQTAIPFSLSGDDSNNGLNKGRNPKQLKKDSCKVNFKIFTYGQAKFWFKKLTVDDFYANKLFDPSPYNNYDSIIHDELSHVGNNINLYSYYMDEVTYSQLPCIKYVMNKISAYPNIKFMVSESNWMATNVMRKTDLGHSLTLKTLHPRILNVFAYELWGGNDTGVTYIPAFALNYIEPKLPVSWQTQNYNTYNNYLQNVILGSSTASGSSGNGVHGPGSFIYQVCLAKQNIKDNSSNTMLYITPQMQGEMCIDSSSGNLISVREPLNEEIEAQTMSALSHGAQGLVGYIFQTAIDSTRIYSQMSHVYGLYGRINALNHLGDYRRTKNHYGENKWEFIKKMNGKINSWIPTLDKTTWQDGFSVHSEGATHYFINNIQSLYVTNNGGQPECVEDNIWADCNSEKYWEEGFFSPKNTSDNSKYFLMTNRRCVPEIAGINRGDLRQLKIYFMASQLTGFNNWKIINVENDSLIATYNKSNPTYVDFGVFQPREGKLFKITPAFQIGGTLAEDETLSGNINCDGMIFNGGHNITISPNATISFSDSAGIEMDSGFFTCEDNDNAYPVTFI